MSDYKIPEKVSFIPEDRNEKSFVSEKSFVNDIALEEDVAEVERVIVDPIDCAVAFFAEVVPFFHTPTDSDDVVDFMHTYVDQYNNVDIAYRNAFFGEMKTQFGIYSGSSPNIAETLYNFLLYINRAYDGGVNVLVAPVELCVLQNNPGPYTIECNDTDPHTTLLMVYPVGAGATVDDQVVAHVALEDPGTKVAIYNNYSEDFDVVNSEDFKLATNPTHSSTLFVSIFVGLLIVVAIGSIFYFSYKKIPDGETKVKKPRTYDEDYESDNNGNYSFDRNSSNL